MDGSITRMYHRLAREDSLTIGDAVLFLEREAKQRTFSEILQKYCSLKEGKRRIIQGLKENHPELRGGSVERRVRGWMNGKHDIRKKDALELCFHLGLELEQAEEFVTLISEETFHWRDPFEIIMIISLANGYSYRKAMALVDKWTVQAADSLPEITHMPFTALVKKDVEEIRTEEELFAYLSENAVRLGRFHNNAFNLFIQRLSILEKPEPSYEGEKNNRYSIRDILREYLLGRDVAHAKVLAKRTRTGKISPEEGLVLSAVQKKVVSSWPDEATLSRMRTRKTDVTRKALILLLMATEKGFIECFDACGELPSKEEIFDDINGRLNQTLRDCGFAPLDPRSPFDWMILYSICAQDMADADERMRNLFARMFAPSG